MKVWREMTLGERFAFVRGTVINKGWTFNDTGVAAGTTGSAIAGFVHRNRDALNGLVPAPKGARANTVPKTEERHNLHTEAHFTEKWEDRKARRRPNNRPSNAQLGIPRDKWVWAPEKKERFKRLYLSGAQYKVIIEELGIGSKTAVINMRDALGLPPRQRQGSGDKRKEIKVRVTAEELTHLRRRATEKRMSTSMYVARLVAFDAGKGT